AGFSSGCSGAGTADANRVQYNGLCGIARYVRNDADVNHAARTRCIAFGSMRVAPAVAAEVLHVISPLALHRLDARKIIETNQLLHDFIEQEPTLELAARTFTWRSRCTSKMRSCSFGSSELTYGRCQGRTSRLPITDSLDATTPI